ncbi:MAG: LacI family DNA-binding transcriptional regulator [Roseobacter sp.]
MAAKKIKISDIADLTGLSRATIDRVLNDRDGVKLATQQKVKKAVRDLKVARDGVKTGQFRGTMKLRVVLPKGSNPFFSQLRSGFNKTLAPFTKADVSVIFQTVDPYEPSTLIKALEQTSKDTNAVITLGVDIPEFENSINTLVDRGVRVVTVVSDVPNSKRAVFVGQDNFVTGRTAGRLMLNALPKGECSIAVIIGHLHFRHLLDRQAGFQQVIGLERPEITVLPLGPYGADPQNTPAIIAKIKALRASLKGVYIAGGGQPYLAEAISKLDLADPVIIGHEKTLVSQAHLQQGTFKFILAHDVQDIAEKAVAATLDETTYGTRYCGIHMFVKENFPEILV